MYVSFFFALPLSLFFFVFFFGTHYFSVMSCPCYVSFLLAYINYGNVLYSSLHDGVCFSRFGCLVLLEEK